MHTALRSAAAPRPQRLRSTETRATPDRMRGRLTVSLCAYLEGPLGLATEVAVRTIDYMVPCARVGRRLRVRPGHDAAGVGSLGVADAAQLVSVRQVDPSGAARAGIGLSAERSVVRLDDRHVQGRRRRRDRRWARAWGGDHRAGFR